MYTSESELIEKDILGYLQQHQNKELLRFVICGSVDDGKSTLIGRLLHDTHGIYEDQLSAVKRATKQEGTEIDFSLVTDGLKAEREQGITIDVAYRYFSTANRKFIVADTPGHVQYTRNMATGASTANVAVILIDARLGVLQQSKRHAYIASLLGIPHLCVAVNKLDLQDYSEDVFNRIRADFEKVAARLAFKDVTYIPMSALAGANVAEKSSKTPYHNGPTLLEYLERVPVADDRNVENFRFPVQYVLRPHLDYRGFAGQIASGTIATGDEVVALPSNKRSTVTHIDSFDGELTEAATPMSVSLRLADEIDVSRGDMLLKVGDLPRAAKRFDAMLVWMSERALDPNKNYLLKHTTQYVRADVTGVNFVTDLETLEQHPADTLALNDIGSVSLACHRELHFDEYQANRSTGAFVLIDSLTNNTVAAGMILPRETGGNDEDADDGPVRSLVSDAERREVMGQRGACIWLTGNPGAGKSALAYRIERLLTDAGRSALVVDPADRHAPGARDGQPPGHAAEFAARLCAASVNVVFAYASPGRGVRDDLRERLGDQFVEVFVAGGTPMPSYEPPATPDVKVSLEEQRLEAAAASVIAALPKD